MAEWGWVAGGYALTAGTLLAYVIGLRVRERAARRARERTSEGAVRAPLDPTPGGAGRRGRR